MRSSDPDNRISLIQSHAQKLGFSAVGVTNDFKLAQADYFQKWLSEGKNATMGWLEKNTDKRLNPNLLMENCRSVIVTAFSYNHEPAKRDFQMARYAHGEDYHIWLKEKLEKLAEFIRDQIAPGFVWRSFVDTGPIVERDLAAKAGIGWIGKNTCLINEDAGSFVFLGVILNNTEWTSSVPASDLCATCRLCIEACPTQALESYQLNASRCLAYHNIERRGERDPAFANDTGDWLVGCDICQEVCPHNHRAPLTQNQDWLDGFSKFEMKSLEDWKKISAEDYKKKFRSSAIARIKFEDMQRNVLVVEKNK